MATNMYVHTMYHGIGSIKIYQMCQTVLMHLTVPKISFSGQENICYLLSIPTELHNSIWYVVESNSLWQILIKSS